MIPQRHSPRATRALTLLATAAIALTGSSCGSGDEAGTPGAQADRRAASKSADGIRHTYAAFIDAVYERDFEAACATMTRALQRQLDTGKGCPRGLEDVYGNGTFDPHKPKIVQLDVQGDSASAKAKSQTTPAATPLRFTRHDGTWKMTTATPPGS